MLEYCSYSHRRGTVVWPPDRPPQSAAQRSLAPPVTHRSTEPHRATDRPQRERRGTPTPHHGCKSLRIAAAVALLPPSRPYTPRAAPQAAGQQRSSGVHSMSGDVHVRRVCGGVAGAGAPSLAPVVPAVAAPLSEYARASHAAGAAPARGGAAAPPAARGRTS